MELLDISHWIRVALTPANLGFRADRPR